MTDFHLVDLDIQAEQVALTTQGWPVVAILEWLAQFGQVVTQRANDGVYVFHAHSGVTTGFVLRDNGDFLIIYDHTTRQVSSD